MIYRLLRVIPSLWSNWFGKSLIVFVFVQVVFVVLARFESVTQIAFVAKWLLPQGIERAQTTFLAVCVHILVAFNTIIFLFHALSAQAHASKLESVVRRNFEKKYGLFICFLVISVFISAAIMVVLIIGNTFSVPEPEWKILLKVNEVLTVVLFSVFSLADLWCVDACNIALNEKSGLDENGRAELNAFREDLWMYLYASDGPGLLGMILITFISFVLQPVLAGLHWQGFITGAIGLHIVFSQATLAFLNVKKTTD